MTAMTTAPSRWPVAALVWGVAVPAVIWTCLVAGLIFVVPGYKKTFADFGIQVPADTLVALEVTDWVTTYWYVLLIWLPFLAAADAAVVLLLWRSGRRGLCRLWCGLVVALALLAAALTVVAIYLPLTRLQEQLSK
jgi:type II secretory pathway component PulF